MKRYFSLAWMMVAAGAVGFVFQMSDEVQLMERQLRATQDQILADQEAIQVLQAEWSYLNQPNKIADLAGRHLSLDTLSPEKVIAFEDLPWRRLTDEEMDAAKARYLPDGTIIPGMKPLLVTAEEQL
ncbi:MAG: hypothetical protein AAF530_11225 [Pseudomonadota bacterium]